MPRGQAEIRLTSARHGFARLVLMVHSGPTNRSIDAWAYEASQFASPVLCEHHSTCRRRDVRKCGGGSRLAQKTINARTKTLKTWEMQDEKCGLHKWIRTTRCSGTDVAHTSGPYLYARTASRRRSFCLPGINDQMERNVSIRWRNSLATAAFFAGLVLLTLTYRNYNVSEAWTSQDLAASTGPKLDIESGHGPTTHESTDPNDISQYLHPEQHVSRGPRIVELHWNVTKDCRRPDGVAKDTYLINGQFPGPAVELRSGDELIVNLHNGLVNESTSIHWHGLKVANDMDGVVGVTQCSIAPGQEFQYRLTISEAQWGSFWYHAHSETQRADGLFGPLIVHRSVDGQPTESEEYRYDDDQVLLTGDWYHHGAREVLKSYDDWKNFKIEPAPDSLLLNGRGYFECSRATRARPVDCKKNEVPHLTISDRSRLRVVNVGALTGITISLVGYTVQLIQVDGGHAVESVRSEKIGILYPGERMDMILERKRIETFESGWITVSLDRENMRFPNMALIDTQQFPISTGSNGASMALESGMQLEPKSVPWIDLSNISGIAQNVPGVLPGDPADKTILLYTTINYLTQYEYRPRGFVNHSSWTPSMTALPLLAQERSEWPPEPSAMIQAVPQGCWVDVVINNLDDKGHPFHLHGHDFSVLVSRAPERPGAFEQYNPFDEASDLVRNELELKNPVVKDTVYVPSMGFVILRFHADNPGIWMLHCHLLWHEAVGMNAAIQVGPDAGASQRKAASRTCES